MAKSHVMSTPIPRMNALFVGCAPRLPGSLNVMKGTNQLSLPASSPFSAALSLYLRLLNLSRLDTAMMKKLSNSCVPSFATTKWSCAFLGSRTPFMLCRLNRHWPVGSQPPPAPAAPHIAPLPEGLELDPPATSQLHQPASARGQAPKRPAPETPASTASEGPPSGPLSPAHPSQPSARSSDPPLTAYSGPSRTPVGATLHILISELLLQPVKVKAQTQGKARALVPPTPILQAKARRAKKARKARRVKKVKTPKVTRAKKGNKENTPGPSWKVARVQPRVTRNNCFSPSVHPAISCFIGSSIYTFHSLLPPLSIRLPAFNRLTSTFPLHAHTLPPAARTQSVIPAHSVLCSFSLISTTCHTGLFPSSSPRPSRSFRPTRSAASSFSSVQPWLNRSFRPTRPLAASTCFPHPHHFHNHPQPRLSRSFRPTRSLAHSLLVLLSLALLFISPFTYFFSTARTQSVIPAHSVFGGLNSLFHSPLPLLHFCLDSVGHSGPLSLRLPLIRWLLPLPFSLPSFLFWFAHPFLLTLRSGLRHRLS